MSEYHVIQTGTTKRDAGCWWSGIPWSTYSAWPDKRDREQQVTIGINSLLLEMGGMRVLVDTGMGHHAGSDSLSSPWRLLKGLRQLGISRDEIGLVIVTNPGLEHCGGITDRRQVLTTVNMPPRALPTFKRATLLGHVAAQDVEDVGLITEPLVTGTILPGLSVEQMDGSYVVRATVGGERLLFVSDVIPTWQHLLLDCLPSSTPDRPRAIVLKQRLTDEALAQGSLMIFAHGLSVRSAYIEQTRDGMRVRSQEK